MSWGTDVKCDSLFLIRESYKTKSDLHQAIEETQEDLVRYATRLKMLIAGDVKTFADVDCDIAWWINNEVDDIVETIREGIINNYIRGKLLDNWELNQKNDE